MALLRHVTVWLFALLLPIAGYGQQKLFTQYKFHRLDEAHGLTNNVINDILQDSLGQVWVATEEGLFRYQGFDFQRFIREKNNAYSLHNNFVGRLYLDRDKNVWLTTEDGISRYSYETDVITRFLPEEIYGRIHSMVIDEQGAMYLSRHDGGIWKVVGDSVSLLALEEPERGLDFGKVSTYSLCLTGNRIWVATEELGVITFDTQYQHVVHFSAQEIAGVPKLRSFDLYHDGERVWLGTDESVYGLALDAVGNKVIDRRLTDILPKDDYLSTFKDAQGNFWIGSRQSGMYNLSLNSQNQYQVVRHFTPATDEYSISHRTVSKIFQEESGFFWLGTHNGGINVFHPSGESVRTVTRQSHNPVLSLAYQNVWGIAESRNGHLWVGLDGKGISTLDPNTGTVTNNVIPELGDKAVLSIREDSHDRLWIGTYAHGVFLYDLKKKTIRSYSSSSAHSDLLVNDIRCFYEMPDGQMLIGTNLGGLYWYDEGSASVRIVSELPLLDIRAITQDQSGQLWLGTYGRGLVKFDLQRRKIQESPWAVHPTFAREVVFDIHNDGRVLWVATRHHGAVVYDQDSHTFLEPEALQQMEGKSISAIQSDEKGRFWITTSTGVLCYNPVNGDLKQFTSKNGFQSGHFNFGSILLSKAGFMVAGGIHGMNLFYPEDLLREPARSEIVLHQFKIFNQSVNPLNSVIFPADKSIYLTDKVMLDHSDNIFSIHFSLPGFTTHSKSEFNYRLAGYEDEWQFGAESNVGTYRNVPPGSYTFQVRSLQNGAEKELKVIISPPWWKTWQAYLAYILLVVLVVWRLNKFNSSRIALRQKLEFEQELREKEHLIMQEKLRFYTNFSHELKTPLTLIQGPVNDLMKTEKDPHKLQYLRLIRKNTRVILRFIRRMLEFRKIEMNKTILNVGRHDLKILAQEEAESFGYHAKEKGIKFGFYCENEIDVWVDLEKIHIIMNNLLSNAFKFTSKGKTVNFWVYQNDTHVMVEVKDEGIGIRQEELPNVFSPFFQASNSTGTGGTGIGLALTKSFVELHLGEIRVQSQVGIGSTFLVAIPKDKEALLAREYVRVRQDLGDELDNADLSSDPENGEENALPGVHEKLIMIVDDNKDIATYLKTLFENEFGVVQAYNGVEALHLALQTPPDIIISDMMMPGMDGVEFCRKVKEHMATSHIPVIMLTAKDSKHDRISGYEVGADDYITKPFSSELLVARVNNLLKGRKLLELHYEASDLISMESHQHSREAAFILKAEEIILNKLDHSDLNVPDLCTELGMSQPSLYRKIKSLTGDSIQNFIRRIKIKRAAQLLHSEDLSVSEVAFALDFSDLKYFRKCFKEQFQMTPSEYKNAHGKKRGGSDEKPDIVDMPIRELD